MPTPPSSHRRLCLRAASLVPALGLLPAARAENLDLTSQIEAIRKTHDLPALACMVLIHGEVLAHAVVGARKYGSPVRVAMRDKFHLGSCTKAMTAHLCAQLVEAGKLSWDQPLVEVLPEFAQDMHSAYRNLSLNHLLCQQSGFSADSETAVYSLRALHQLSGSATAQRALYLHSVLAETPVNKPGSQFLYSNRNFVLAGYLAERVAGEEWESLMQTRIFRAFAMSSAGFGAMNTPGLIDQPWQHVMNGSVHTPVDAGPLSDNPVALAPASRVHMSLPDWAQFAQDHLRGLRGEGGQLLAASYQHLHTPLSNGSYAGGWGVLERAWGGGTVYSHSGSNTMNFCTIWLAPQKNLTLLIACNQGGNAAALACDQAATKALQAIQQSL
jgi:CubicO group peptidase (beta-lactamase class C family)